jgi:chromosome segregation ATPase
MKTVELTRESLRTLLDDEAHESAQVTDLQSQLTRHVLEARTMREELQKAREHVDTMEGVIQDQSRHIEGLRALVMELGKEGKVTIKQLVILSERLGVHLSFIARKAR